jgi:hypothetical protein
MLETTKLDDLAEIALILRGQNSKQDAHLERAGAACASNFLSRQQYYSQYLGIGWYEV